MADGSQPASAWQFGVGRTSRWRRYPPPLWIGTLAITVFFADISVTGTLQPFYIDEVLHAEIEWVGVAITAQFACATIGLFLTGLLADAIGLRRTVILVCVANVVLLNLVGRTRSIAELLAVRCLLGLASTYALALSWVASLAPRARLARWMSATVCAAQLAVSLGGFVAGAMRGRDLAFAMLLVSVAPATVALVLLRAHEVRPPANVSPPPPVPAPLASPSEAEAALAAPAVPEAAAPAVAAVAAAAVATGTPTKGRSGVQRALRTRYFWGVALAPLVQGCYIGGVMQSLAPLVLKTAHGWGESGVARLFQVGGLGALLTHASLTPYLSGVPWRHRAAQGLAALTAATSLAYDVLGERYASAALVLPAFGFVTTACGLGVVNVMVPHRRRAAAPPHP